MKWGVSVRKTDASLYLEQTSRAIDAVHCFKDEKSIFLTRAGEAIFSLPALPHKVCNPVETIRRAPDENQGEDIVRTAWRHAEHSRNICAA